MIGLTLDHLLWRMRNVYPDSEVVSVRGDEDALFSLSTNFRDESLRIEALAGAFRHNIRLEARQSIVVLGWNDQEHLEVLLAGATIGCVVNSVNVRFGRKVIDHLIEQTPPNAVVLDAGLLENQLVKSDIAEVVCKLEKSGTPIIAYRNESGIADRFHAISYEDLVENNMGHVLRARPPDENATAFIFHSSGSTGWPKSYRVSHRAAMLHCLSQATVDASGIASIDKVLPLAPIFHVNGWGLPLTSFLTGASQVLIGGNLNSVRIARILEHENVTVAAAVPTVWHDVCLAVSNGEADKPSVLREVLTGGSSVPKRIADSINSVLGASVANAWGMTETMACSTYERTAPETRVGKPIPLIELTLEGYVNSDLDVDAPPGRLLARGPFVIGHKNKNGWCQTSDIAAIDHNDNIQICDREDDLVKSGGEWIASAELEQRLCAHPNVEAAVVVAVNDPRWIERPQAYVSLQNKELANEGLEKELANFVAEKFPKWWVPDKIVVLDEMPTTAVGKIDKSKIKCLARKKEAM